MDERTWTVGELAAASGLSVRVLRHWDEVGIVRPGRTPSGHRRYGSPEITRLYRALALRRTGLGLEAIGRALDEQTPDPTAVLEDHLAQLETEIERSVRLRDRLRAALSDDGSVMAVISAMTMVDGYVHGYRAEEGSRLADQAEALEDLLHHDTAFPAGSHVLEVGCGVGAQTAVIARRSPGARITAIDISADSLARARRRVRSAGLAAGVTFRRLDVRDLPDAGIGPVDHVVVCFVLEHLSAPLGVLRTLRSALRPGGTITVIEGDHASVAFTPDSPAARAAIDCQVVLQRQAGGDAMIGRRLGTLLAEAGFADVTTSPREVRVDDAGPADAFVLRTFTAMIAGVREPAVAAGLTTPDAFDAGLADLRRTAEPGGTFRYTFTRASGVAR
ncbi:methyltransferase [Actinomycetospora sp. CA-084318]|uniref:methyltransferase n=1 Tax=Actinomycetospora sp. CA-084318 TaxID=3239892 RepID=UPI003D98B774